MHRSRRHPAPWLFLGLVCAGILSRPALAGTWVSANNGLRNMTVVGIGIAPSNPSIIYMQARSLGVYKSTNGGITWTKTVSFDSDRGPNFAHLIHDGPVVHPTDPNTVWATSSGQVYKTTNGGGSWALSSAGTTVNGCNGVQGVVLDPNDPNHLFAGTIISGCDGGVFESTNGGGQWSNIAGSQVPGSGIGNDAWPIALDASNPSRLYSGSPHNSVYRSSDGGNVWINSPPVTGDASSYEVTVNPLLPNQIWSSVSARGTWTSANSGATWTRRTDLFGDLAVSVLCFAPSDAQIAYAIVGNTIWQSTNNAVNWVARADVPGGPKCLAVDPTNPNVVYVGTWGLGMFKSTDGAASFTEINSGLPLTSLIHGSQAFAVGDTLYAILSGNTMYHSARSPIHWEYYSAAPSGYIQGDRFRPNRWYCASGGFWRSLDYGQTWSQCYSEGAATYVYGFWLDPRICDRIWIGDRNGSKVLLSEDGGDTWTVKGTIPLSPAGFTYLSDLCGDPFDPNVVIVPAYPTYTSNRQHGYVWRTGDGGQTWSHVRDRMFYGDWRIGDGEWSVEGYTLHQRIQPYCNYRVVLDHHTFGDGTFECKMRIANSYESDPANWVGFTIRHNSPDGNYTTSGWLVFMRRSGEVALYNATDKTVLSSVAAPDPTQWTTIRLQAIGNSFELFVNGSSIGTYVDPNHRWDGPGYVGLVTCKTDSYFDDVNIQAETAYTDGFSISPAYGASLARWATADPRNPGRLAFSTQGGGVWLSTDHGLTWHRITGTDREGSIFYRPTFSMARSGNLYLNDGSGYNWRFENYHNDGTAFQQIGQNLSYSSIVTSEDTVDPNRLYGAVYSLGILVYDAADIVGDPVPPIPVRWDFDQDSDMDQRDFGHIQACLSGPGIPQPNPDCANARLDADPDVDSDDMSLFLQYLSGPGIAPDPACDCPQ